MKIETSLSDQKQKLDHPRLYVFSPSKKDRLYQLQMDTLSDRQLALDDHHVVIAEVFEHEEGHLGTEQIRIENGHGLRRNYHIMPGQFKVVLVGMDSSVKLCAESCVSCEEVIMRVENELAQETETTAL